MRIYVIAYEVGGVLDGADVFTTEEALDARIAAFEAAWAGAEEGYANYQVAVIKVDGDDTHIIPQ